MAYELVTLLLAVGDDFLRNELRIGESEEQLGRLSDSFRLACVTTGSSNAMMNTSFADANRVCSCQKCLLLNEKAVGEPWDEERYLCVIDGLVMYCLDLKRSKDESKESFNNPQPLPIIDTRKLLERKLSITGGLFKLGPNAFMVSGQEFYASDLQEHPKLKLPYGLFDKYERKGTSCKTYHLSLTDGALCLSECYSIPALSKPKSWPVVEKIGNQLHVIEISPPCFVWPPRRIPSHEVLDLDNRSDGWREVSSMWSPAYPISIGS